ncbi:opine dehydrogenase [Patella vulgata]|uniref:opine dehydrogenase n=1 Tax=Patella vulgata TaxID=6465 RepID=UPI002180923E|nr:opine dehydrogenase [Patella vulgata]
MSETLTAVICGGGNAAHVMTGLASSRENVDIRVLDVFSDEAERWTKTLGADPLVLTVNHPDGTHDEVRGKPNIITNDASLAVPGASVIIFAVPAFAHESYFQAIKPYLKANTTIVGMPGQPGFEFQCFSILKDTAPECCVVAFEGLPWAARISEFGRAVTVLSTKDFLGCVVIKGKSNVGPDPLKPVQYLLGPRPVAQIYHNFLEPTLNTKSIMHPPIMYGTWYEWDGQPLDSKPLFYQGLNAEAAELMSGMSDELIATAREISRKKPEINLDEVGHLFDWFKLIYKDEIKDKSSLLTALQTNSAYNGLLHPMKETPDGKFLPDFTYRYMTEDVPFGLVVLKGISEIAGVATPVTDKVLAWSQKMIGKEYIVGDKLCGKDVATSRAPQRYGYKTLDDFDILLQ